MLLGLDYRLVSYIYMGTSLVRISCPSSSGVTTRTSAMLRLRSCFVVNASRHTREGLAHGFFRDKYDGIQPCEGKLAARSKPAF